MRSIKDTTKQKLEATEMDFWRRVARRSRLERVTNDRIGEIIQVMHTIVDEIKNRQIILYGHVQECLKLGF